MSITLGSNIASLQSQRRLGETENRLAQVFERLSSGQRINRASDDAAGLAIAETLRSEQRVFAQGVRNINDGLSALNIADSATGELQSIIGRLRELATQSANGVFSAEQRQALQTESRELTREYNRIVATTEFNGRKLLDGQFGSAAIEFGTDEGILINPGDGLSQIVASGETTGSLDFFSGGTDVALDSVDFDQDGDIDILTVDTSTGVVRLLENDGSGGYSISGSFSAFTTNATANMSARFADINGDGELDIVSGGAIYQGDGTGNFTLAVTISSTLNFAIGDFNGDGVDDSAFYSLGSLNITSFANGEFTTTAITTSGSGGAGSPFVGDINGDGYDDIIRRETAGSYIYYGSAEGIQEDPEFVSGISAEGVGDFDGDGYADFVTAEGGGTIAVRFGDGNGNFSESVLIDTGLVGLDDQAYVGDINGDGIDDFVVGRNGQGFSVVQGSEFRNLNTTTNLDASYINYSVADLTFADTNGDGAVDLLNGENVFLSATTKSSRLEQVDISSQSDALEALEILEEASLRLSDERASLGALQSRLSVALSTTDVTRENYAAAESRIRDADIAAESAELTRNGILRQAAASVLAQANQQPQLALLLLG